MPASDLAVVIETTVDALTLLAMGRDENTCRKQMTPEDLRDLGAELEALERPKARERIAEHANTAPGRSAEHP